MIETLAGEVRFDQLAASAQQSLYLKTTEVSTIVAKIADTGKIQKTWLERGGKKPKSSDRIIVV